MLDAHERFSMEIGFLRYFPDSFCNFFEGKYFLDIMQVTLRIFYLDPSTEVFHTFRVEDQVKI